MSLVGRVLSLDQQDALRPKMMVASKLPHNTTHEKSSKVLSSGHLQNWIQTSNPERYHIPQHCRRRRHRWHCCDRRHNWSYLQVQTRRGQLRSKLSQLRTSPNLMYSLLSQPIGGRLKNKKTRAVVRVV